MLTSRHPKRFYLFEPVDEHIFANKGNTSPAGARNTKLHTFESAVSAGFISIKIAPLARAIRGNPPAGRTFEEVPITSIQSACSVKLRADLRTIGGIGSPKSTVSYFTRPPHPEQGRGAR